MRAWASAEAPVTMVSPSRMSPPRSALRRAPSRPTTSTSPVTLTNLPAACGACAHAPPLAAARSAATIRIAYRRKRMSIGSEVHAHIDRKIGFLVFENRQVAVVLDVDQLRPQRPAGRERPGNSGHEVVEGVSALAAECHIEVLVL